MRDSLRSPNVFTIPGTSPFLETLHEALVAGRLIDNWDPEDPLAWSDLTILVPTRRAGRAFRDLFLQRSRSEAVILPRIRPIGDVDEDLPELETDDADPAIKPAISNFDRHLGLTKLVMGWTRALQGKPGAAAPIRVPASPADAAWLAQDLAALMDQVATEEVPWSGLHDLVPDDHAAYWQLSLAFLQIATDAWPNYLKERGLLAQAERRSLLIDREAQRLQAADTGKPIIAAGSTGSIPATARLLKTIAHLPRGAVVLPGLPTWIDDETWQAIGTPLAGETSPSHPLYGMKHLIEEIGIERADIVTLSPQDGDSEDRTRQNTIVEVFRPAEVTDRWRSLFETSHHRDTLANIDLVEAPGDHEEAAAIALLMREFREKESGQAALITPDRRLARRVAQALRRWNIEVDDSAGEPLTQTPAGVLMRLVAETALSGFDPVVLVSLLKHPLALFGRSPAFIRNSARALEIGVLRGPLPAPGPEGLRAAIEAIRSEQASETRHHAPHHRRYVSEQAWKDIEALLDLVEAVFKPFAAFRAAGEKRGVASILHMHVDAVRAIVKNEDQEEDAFFSHADGSVLLKTLAGLLSSRETDIALAPEEYPDFLECLLAGIPVRPNRISDPMLQIWGPLEARLQSPDLTILGGANEGVWPALARTDPWLSRPMRTGMALQPPERRIGLSAHDFMQGLSGKRVVITRSERTDGSPTVPSRWLQRLRPVVGGDAFDAMKKRGDAVLGWGRQLDVPVQQQKPASRPNPAPPVAARPDGLSVTEVETLIRDPYAFYARRVLRLEPVAAIGMPPDFADRGTLIHEILGAFTNQWSGPFDERALEALLRTGKDQFAVLDAFPSLQTVWWSRFTKIAETYIAWERDRDPDIDRRLAEISAFVEIPLADKPAMLRARADRIDRRRDGALDIIDFKTGTVPSSKQVNAGFAPQLPLEGAMIQRGGFKTLKSELPPGPPAIAKMNYVQLKPGTDGFLERSAIPKGEDGAAIIDKAWSSLTALLTRYRASEQGYLSRAYPMRSADHSGRYDHLARVGEWSLHDEGDDE